MRILVKKRAQTFILSVGNNSQGHSYARWLWKGLAVYKMHVKESTGANIEWHAVTPGSAELGAKRQKFGTEPKLLLQLSLSFGKTVCLIVLKQVYPPWSGQGLWNWQFETSVKDKYDPWMGKTGLSSRERSSGDIMLGSYSKTFELHLHISCPSSPRWMN